MRPLTGASQGPLQIFAAAAARCCSGRDVTVAPTESGSLLGRPARRAPGAGVAELQAISPSQFPSLRTGKMKRRDFNILKHFKII